MTAKNYNTIEKDKNLLSQFANLIIYRTLHKDIVWTKQDINYDDSIYRYIESYKSEPENNNGLIFEIIAYQDRHIAENDNYEFNIIKIIKNKNDKDITIKTVNIEQFDNKKFVQKLFLRILVAARESIEETILTNENYNDIAEYINIFNTKETLEEFRHAYC